MLIFTHGYAMYPGHIKMLLLSLFSSQLLANYVVVQRWILPRDIIKEVLLRTVTSCIMGCSGLNKCIAVGFRNGPNFLNNDKCLLVKNLRKKNKNGTRTKIYALLDEQKMLDDEKKRTLSLNKQQSCPADVNGGYSNWSDYTICSKTCESGVQHRNRSYNHPTPMFGGRNCSVLGNATESRSCNVHPCPINGGYGNWSDYFTMYETCPKTCGSGLQYRNRSCDHPTPRFGGKNCSMLGNATETRKISICPNENTEYHGTQYTYTQNIASWVICHQNCIGTSTCLYWTYYSNVGSVEISYRKRCYLYSSITRKLNERLSKGAIMSGLKQCISGKIRLVNPSQSSTLSSDWPASKVLDGKLRRNAYPLGGCSHTDLINDQNPWWKAELVQTSYITKIKIMPRIECCKTYKHVTIATSMDDATWILCSDLADKLNKASNWVETTCPQGTIARYVKIVQYNNKGMVLCEVEVFGHA